jgi:hypothetical protein
LSLLHRRQPRLHLDGVGELCQWHVPNVAGHRRTVASGFGIEQQVRPYAIPLGTGHPSVAATPRARATLALMRPLLGNAGVPHSAVLARPAV